MFKIYFRSMYLTLKLLSLRLFKNDHKRILSSSLSGGTVAFV